MVESGADVGLPFGASAQSAETLSRLWLSIGVQFENEVPHGLTALCNGQVNSWIRRLAVVVQLGGEAPFAEIEELSCVHCFQ